MVLLKHSIYKVILSIIIFFLGISFTWVCVQAASTSQTTIRWRQVNENGFGSLQSISALDSFDGYLYAGTWANPYNNGEVWRTADGKNWQNFTPVLLTDTQVIADAQSFNGFLYIGTSSYSWDGAEIWRTDGLNWELTSSGGFGDVNWAVNTLAVFSNTLIAATSNITTGVEVWGSPTGDPGSWVQVNTDGFGLGITGQDSTMDTFNSNLYFGMGLNGLATLLRTDDLITWTPVFTNGLGNPNNSVVTSMAEYKGMFYIGLRNLTDGGEVWRSSDGLGYSPVVLGGMGNPNNMRPYGLIVYDNFLYLVLNNPITGAEIWRSNNGDDWEQVGFGGWGDSSNYFGDYCDKSATIFHNSLYFGTFNDITGGQIWQMIPNLIFFPSIIK
jgi:hypothetical protein